MMGFRSELTLPIHADAAAVAGAYVRELAALAGLPAPEGGRLADAAVVACADIVRCASGPAAHDAFHVVGLITPRALTVAIRERGAPFDPRALGDDAAPIRARDWAHIRGAVDAAHWSNRGTAGMELHLIKYRRQGNVTEHLPAPELAPFRHDDPPAPPQRYTVRRFQPADAVGVAQSMYRAFGYTYGDADVYYPARIAHLNETGQLVSLVALDEAGAVVGHLGLERPDLGPIAESSDAAVAPSHRHRGLLERLRALAEEEGSQLGLQGLVCYPVTTHPFSQRMEEAAGGRLCAVVLGQLPESTSFTGIAGGASKPQRVSTLLYFKYLSAAPSVVVHAPARHAAVLERLYANLGVAASPAPGPPAVPAGEGHVTVSIDHAWGYGEIFVHRIGTDTAAEVRRAAGDLRTVTDTEVVYLYLPLTDPGTPALCEHAEADGFFFSGLGPRFLAEADALCLQSVPRTFDPSRLEVVSPLGLELLAYVTAERARVA